MQFCRRKRERIKIKREGEVMIVDDFVVAAWLFTISQKVSQTPLRYTMGEGGGSGVCKSFGSKTSRAMIMEV